MTPKFYKFFVGFLKLYENLNGASLEVKNVKTNKMKENNHHCLGDSFGVPKHYGLDFL